MTSLAVPNSAGIEPLQSEEEAERVLLYSRPYRAYVLGLLLACSVLSFIDRQAVSLLVAPIKASLGLSDTQIGLLQGSSFTFVYATAFLLLGWLADTGNRVRIAAVSVAAWSLSTMACGVSIGFLTLLAGRAGTAIGEAGLPPSALSIIGDIFPRRQVLRACSVFMIANSIGAGVALLVTAALLNLLAPLDGMSLPYVGHLEPWKAVFVIIGAPGLLLSFLVMTTVREPARRELIGSSPERAIPLSWRETFAFFGTRKGLFIPIAGCMGTIGAAVYGELAWFPTYLIRTFHVSGQSVGLLVGPAYMIFGLAGGLFAGRLVASTDAVHAARRVTGLLRVVAGLALFPAIAMALVPSYWVAVILFALNTFLLTMMIALVPALLQTIVPNMMRARTMALFNFAGITVAGLAPLLIGYLTDHLWRNELAVGYSIALVIGGVLFGTMVLMILAYRFTVREIAAA
jgi:MFS family permease